MPESAARGLPPVAIEFGSVEWQEEVGRLHPFSLGEPAVRGWSNPQLTVALRATWPLAAQPTVDLSTIDVAGTARRMRAAGSRLADGSLKLA